MQITWKEFKEFVDNSLKELGLDEDQEIMGIDLDTCELTKSDNPNIRIVSHKNVIYIA